MSYATVSRHEQFCIGVANGMTTEQAYISAGYSENGAAQSACRLLRNAQIRSRIRGLRKAMAEQAIAKSGLTREYVIRRLMTIVEQCMQERPLRDETGAVLGYCPYKPMPAIRALELLGKELGMFAPGCKAPRSSKFDNMTMEELERREADLDRQLEELDVPQAARRPRKTSGRMH